MSANPLLTAASSVKRATPKAISIPEMEHVERRPDALSGVDHAKAGEWALYAELAAYAGNTAGEIAGLRMRNVDPVHRSVRVVGTAVDLGKGARPQGTPKSDASNRTSELRADPVQRLAASEEYVFGDGTTPMLHRNYRRVFLPTAKAVGLPDLRFHDVRHFYASDLLRDPHLSVKDVSTRMGNADPSLVLRTYGHLFADAGAGLADRVGERRAAARAKAQGAKVVNFG